MKRQNSFIRRIVDIPTIPRAPERSSFPSPVLAALGIFGLVLIGCGAEDAALPTAETLVQFDASGDPVTGARVTPLIASAVDDDIQSAFARDPNNDATTTDSNGAFSIDYRVPPAAAGIEISIDVPGPDGTATGVFGFRTEVDPDMDGSTISIPRPALCESTDPCGEELLPDLTPIVSRSALGPIAAERTALPTARPRSADLFPEDTWFIDEDTPNRRLLRFPTVAANIGTGPLDVIAEGIDNDGVTATFQRIWTDTWHFRDIASGEFVFHPTHDHIHFDAFERYELVDGSGTIAATAEKVSFCLRDSLHVAEQPAEPTGVVFTAPADCGGTQQIINPGFGDHYHSLLDDQWIDISDVAPGEYTVRVIVDPLDLIVEADESNNVASFAVTID